MSRPLRWGLLGAGRHAQESIAPAFRVSRHAVLHSVAARNLDRARALEPQGACYERYEQLLGDPEVDAVYIALANDAHLEWTLAAVRAGRPVLCEKPIGLREADVDRLIAAQQETGHAIAEAIWYRWHPRIRTIQALLRDGAIGEPRRVLGRFCSHVPEPGYRLDHRRGGGALFDLGSYVASAALWVLGGPPTAIRGRLTIGETGVDVAASAHLTFTQGDADLHVAFGEDAQALVIEGEQGRIDVPRNPFTSGGGTIQLTRASGTQEIPCQGDDTYRIMIDEVSCAFNGSAGWLPTLEETWACATLVDAWRAAAQPRTASAAVGSEEMNRGLACAPRS